MNDQAAGQLSVLVPVFNEEKTVEAVVRRVLALGDCLKEIVVVDDGSRDGTARVVEAVARREPLVRFFRLDCNQGKTAAIRHALAQATGEIVIIQDADLEYDPAEIPDVIAPIVNGHADVVYGSRFLVRRAARVLYFYHYLANRGLTFLSNLFTNRNMSDIETCYKAFRAGVITPLSLTSKGFGMEVEITALVCKTRARTYEVPISYYGRSYEEGKKIGLRDGFQALYYILYYNLIKPRLHSGKEYVRRVNAFLESSAGRAGAGDGEIAFAPAGPARAAVDARERLVLQQGVVQ
ncbi:MAG TPA: glycosyltransferase family 2 protein [Streptosporangiaceae bacterium]|jgi:glycosyltransferase involved in cell wall biosynthesis